MKKKKKHDKAHDTKPETSEVASVDVATLEVKARERDEFLDLLQRARAEMANYQKRTERDRARWTDLAVGGFVMKLLPVLDDFDRALAHADETPDFESFVQGIRLIENKIYDVLAAGGIKSFEPEGDTFDPARHEAMIVENTNDVPDNTVSEVLLKGYTMGDRVLRAAQVKVAKEIPNETGDESEDHNADV